MSYNLFLQCQTCLWRTSSKAILDCSIICHHPPETTVKIFGGKNTIHRWGDGWEQMPSLCRLIFEQLRRGTGSRYHLSSIATMGKKHTTKSWQSTAESFSMRTVLEIPTSAKNVDSNEKSRIWKYAFPIVNPDLALRKLPKTFWLPWSFKPFNNKTNGKP